MKSICRLSGIPLWKSDLLLGFDLADEHPIFKAKRSLILTPAMIHRFSHAENWLEKKLIYLATLHATYLVEFHCPASPSPLTMESTFFKLFDLAQWVAFAEYKLAKIVSFPQYIIRKDNETLENIRSWLDAIEDIRVKVNRKEIERDKNAELLQKENDIKRELGEANFFGKAFTPKLAKWALELCDIGPRDDNYSKYIKILCTPLTDAWIYKMEDLLEIQEILQLRLPNLEGNPQAISVMFQMSSIIKECRKGFTEVSLFGSEDDNDTEVKDWEFVEEDKETHESKVFKINQHLLNVPTSEPILKDYLNKTQFMIAKAKWDIAQRKKQISEDNI